METAQQEIPTHVVNPSKEVRLLRLSLILEELQELASAFGMERSFQEMMLSRCNVDYYNGEIEQRGGNYGLVLDTDVYDTVEALDALADLTVVLDGTILSCGMHEIFPSAMSEVFRSNMSKFPMTIDEAGETISDYARKGISVICDMGATPPLVVKRRSDGKILKSVSYSPAELTQFFT